MYNKKLKFTFNSLIFVFGILFGQLGYASNSEIENCSGYKTYSQGGWGNPTSAQGVYLSNNFSTVFPNGITVGSNTKYLKFTSALAVTNFLPSGGTSGRIGDVTLTNPLTSNAGNLGGQLLAVMINAEVDAKISSFARSSGNLYDLKIAKGYFTNFTVRELIKEANEYISGKVVTYSVTDLLSALDGIIKSYDNGEQASADDLYIVCQLKNTSINTNVLCNGDSTGTIEITSTSGGKGDNYTYNWSNGKTGAKQTKLTAGTYYVTTSALVSTGKYITRRDTFTITEPTKLNASSSLTTKVLCKGGDATVTISANGGTAPYTGTGTFTVKAGTHEYTVTDANGCTSITSIIVVEPTALNASSSASTILCNGGDATITVKGNGGTKPYSGTGTFTVKAGTYEYTVTDSNGCTATTSITVVEPSELKANSSLTAKVLCNGGDATITISGNGGTAPYTGTGTFTVKAGTHEYTVTDSNGCTAITSITVDEPSLLSIGSSATDILCNGGNSTVTIIADGGTAPYTGTGTFTVKAGTHEYTVTDANGCSKSTSITVTEPNKLSLTGTIVKDESCNGGLPNGSATLTVTGGTSPYTYVWTNANSTSNIATGLAYNTTPSVVVTDANGCSSSYTFETITCIIVCPPLKTFTQGGWGSTPNGNNPGTYLNANFASAFPLGLTIGKGTSKAVFTSATAIRNFLPSSGNSALLPKTILTNPTKTNLKNTLAGQLVAAMLNVGFDTYSPAFAAPDKKLADMLINTGTFKGMSVTALLNEANNAISGGSTRYTLTQFTEALTKINENYDNGTVDKAFLICPPVQTLTRGLNNENTTTSNTLSTSENNTIKLYPNPASSNFFLSFESNIETTGTIKLMSLAGQLISVETISISQGVNNFEVDLASKSINANMIIVELKYNDVIKHSMLMVK